jgi:uncharacterized membrane protein YdjX (TVP38/TMEM64 family)
MQRYRKWLVAGWLLALGLLWLLAWLNHASLLKLWRHGVAFMAYSPYGPLIFLAAYAFSPLLLFSTTVLSISAGFLFGPFAGVLLTLLGSNLTASIAYLIGCGLGQRAFKTPDPTLARRWLERLRRSGFMAVLMMHLLYLPFELIAYLAGFARLRYGTFLLATVLGSLPGAFSFVLFGSSLQALTLQARPHLRPWTLAASLLIFACSLLGSWYLRRQRKQP